MHDNHVYAYHRNRLVRAVKYLRARQMFGIRHKMRLDMVAIRQRRGRPVDLGMGLPYGWATDRYHRYPEKQLP